MIFSSVDETCEYINKLLAKDIDIYEKHIKKICELNNIAIQKEEFIAGDSYAAKVDSISLVDGKLQITYQKQAWLKHIPSLYHQNDFLKRFLAGFQQSHQMIESKIDNISDQFRADKTEYIDWLASWLGISISNNVDEIAKRRLVSDMVRLYSIRGTKSYFIDIIRHLTSVDVRIENTHEYKTLHHNLIKKDFSKKLINVYIDKKISSSKSIEEKKLHFIQMILEHEKPIGVEYKIIYEFKKEPIASSSVDGKNSQTSSQVQEKHELEPVSEKIEELKEEFNKGLEEIEVKPKELSPKEMFELEDKEEEPLSVLDKEPKVKDDEIIQKDNGEEKKTLKEEDTQKEKSKSEEKLFKIDNEVDDYYSYDNLE